MIENKTLIANCPYLGTEKADLCSSYRNEMNMPEGVTIGIVAGFAFLLFCNALRLRNKPENVAKRKEQKRLLEEKKLELKKAYIKKLKKNPLKNNDSDEYFEVHMQRLQKFGKSQYQGMTYYMGSKGGIYTLSASGSRNYKY